ncbi:hypothetical protein [Streptomyces sp. NPDC006335]|uniref:hypothetical protein n=1 Tax=Streptomyces sp. NPDC006335 TaxID=3156895 RepID=UPI0033A25420
MSSETPPHGRYRLLRTPGAGGMGRVRPTYDDEPACAAALKEIALPDAPTHAGRDSPAHRPGPQPPEADDRVQAVWAGTPCKSVPNVDGPDGQVVAADLDDAKARGAKPCASLSRAVVDALPDAAGHDVVPTGEGFRAADRRTASLGRHAASGGEVGRGTTPPPRAV